MKIGIIGAGYVGLVTAIGFARLGHRVILEDIDQAKIRKINEGQSPFFEPGLDQLLPELVARRELIVTCNINDAVRENDIIIICVSTPSCEDGHIDITYLQSATEQIGDALHGGTGYPVIVVKSSVIPGTTEKAVIPILEERLGGKVGKAFGVVMNPEFLSEGKALDDFLHPSRIIIGAYDKKSSDIVHSLYGNDFACPILHVDLKTAEMIKYASNVALATRVSMINEIGNICKLMGISIFQVAEGMRLDPRIGSHYLEAGVGFGGSCLPKDISALIAEAQDLGYDARLLRSALEVNEKQPARLVALAEAKLGSLKGKTVAVLGLAFKPDTDDVRESPALKVIEELLRKGAYVNAYDPVAEENAKKVIDTGVCLAHSAEEAMHNASVVFVVTQNGMN